MDGSDDGDTHDCVSELWWEETDNNSNSSDPNSGEMSDDSEEDSEDHPKSIVQDANESFFRLPNALVDLRKQLLGDYVLASEPPHQSTCVRTLTASEIISLQHYVAWRKSNGTIYAYKLHANVLAIASKMEILSQHRAKMLAQNLTEFVPRMVDMCPRSCIAYTGVYESLEKCPYVHGKEICNERRYHDPTSSGRSVPRAQVQILPVMATIRAMFANADTGRLLRNRDSCLQAALHLIGTAATRKYSDFGDSQVHVMHHDKLGLFQDPRDVAFAISTDGA